MRTTDNANVAPVAILLIAAGVLAFQAVVYADEYATQSIITSVDTPECVGDFSGIVGATALIACRIQQGFLFIVNVFLVIFSVVRFMFNAITFNVPGAPFYVRAMFATFFIGSLGWSIAGMFRGVRA